MKLSKSIILCFILMVVAAAVYRIIPGRPFGFAPQYAMAIFGGAIFAKKKEWAFILPLGSLFLSDVLYQVLYNVGYTQISGFYGAQQVVNYILIGALVFFGFAIKKITLPNVFLASVLAPSVYFLLSNFSVWTMTDMYEKTWFGLGKCYAMGLPFYPTSVWSTVLFSGIFFGVYSLVKKNDKQQAAA